MVHRVRIPGRPAAFRTVSVIASGRHARWTASPSPLKKGIHIAEANTSAALVPRLLRVLVRQREPDADGQGRGRSVDNANPADSPCLGPSRPLSLDTSATPLPGIRRLPVADLDPNSGID